MGTAAEDITNLVGALVAALAIISVALRFYSRHMTKTGVQWDDWMILLALAGLATTDIIGLVGSFFCFTP